MWNGTRTREARFLPEDTYNFDFVSKANDLKNFIEEASALLYDINSSEQENK